MNSNPRPRITGFQKSALVSNDDVRDFLEAYLPRQQVEHISEVRYVDRYYSLIDDDQPLERLLITGVNVRSRWSRDETTNEEIIEVFRQDVDGNIDAEQMKSEIAQEVGCSVYVRLSESQKRKYLGLPGVSHARDVITDFGAAYAAFFLERDTFRHDSPEKHDYLAALQ